MFGLTKKISNPPRPWAQKINALLHEQPASDIAHTCFWCIVLGLLGPIVALCYLPLQLLYALVRYILSKTSEDFTYDLIRNESLHNKEMAIVITGCDSGFGKEMACYAAYEMGYVVFAGCLNPNVSWQNNNTNMECATNGKGRIIPFTMDVTKDCDVQGAVQLVRSWLTEESSNNTDAHPPHSSQTSKRVLHALINNAGVGRGGLIDWANNDLSDFHFCMEVNYFGMLRCCKAFLPLLKEQAISRVHPDARILNLTSMAGLVSNGTIGMSAYCASKHAANAFSNILRAEIYHSFHIQVTTINPSFHGTPLVYTMGDVAAKQWDTLDTTKKMEYGEDYFQRYRELCIDLPHSVTWDSAVVIRQVLRCLRMKNAPVELIVGSDARFVLMMCRMLPAWIIDLVAHWNFPPIPSVMKMQ